MSGLGVLQLVAASVAFLPAIVWAIVARSSWRLLRIRRPRHRIFRLTPVMSGGAALAYFFAGTASLIPSTWGPPYVEAWPSAVIALFLASQWSMIVALAVGNHLTRLYLGNPGTAWLAANYAAALLLLVFSLTFTWVIPAPTLERQVYVYLGVLNLYFAVLIALILGNIRHLSRGRPWRPTAVAFVMGRADAVVYAVGAVGLGLFVLAFLVAEDNALDASTLSSLVLTLVSWAFMIPAAARVAREVVRGVSVTLAMLVAITLVLLGAQALAARVPTAGARPLLNFATLATLLFVVVPGQAWIRGGVDALVSRRPRRQRAELQAFLHSLPPELGVSECCRRALVGLARVFRLRGAAILRSDGEMVAEGTLAVEGLYLGWPCGADAGAAPEGGLVSNEFLELSPPLREALLDAGVIAVVPIASPRRRFGTLFLSAGLLGANLDEEEGQVIGVFCDQLALVLDAAELLGRAVGVERSLAHAGKLAAVGETAARIAHEIRNPVTAARSLAQLLASRPTSPRSAEQAALILEELERVERQVAALLRFARHEDFRFEPVALEELVLSTLAGLRPRLDEACVTVETDVPGTVVARGDREKLRQVLVNLVQNAIDAMAEHPAPRRLAVAVTLANGTARLCVSDTGGGIPPDLLPYLFEPFRSGKPQGTGLGLAIAKQTIDAHGGRIAVTPAPERGTIVTVELPALEDAS